MKKLLLATLLLISIIGKSAPQYNIYDNLLSSPSFLEEVEITAKIYAKDILINNPNPTSSHDLKLIAWAQEVLASKVNSVVIYRIASFVCNDSYIIYPNNPTDIYEELLNAYASNVNGYTVFELIGKVNLP